VLESLAHRKNDIKVRKFDINRPGVQGIDFHSPLGAQHAQEGVPNFEIYDPDGKLIAQGFAQGTDKIVEFCHQAGITDDDLRKAGVIQ
jgi:hypothetical protein